VIGPYASTLPARSTCCVSLLFVVEQAGETTSWRSNFRMAKRGRRKKRQAQRRAAKAKTQPAPRRSLSLWLTIIGLVVGCWYLVPASVIEPPTETIDPDHPFELPFQVKNDGYLPAWNVVSSCNIIEAQGGSTRLSNIGQVPTDRPAHTLWKWHPQTAVCRYTGITTGRITMNLRFNWLPVLARFLESDREFTFILQRDADGKLRWLPPPLGS